MEKEEEDQEEKEIREMLSNKTVVSEQKGKKTELPVAVNKKKRILTPWTSEQKEAVTFFFNKNIKMKKAPKRKDCEEIKSLYPELLANKDWLKIKFEWQAQRLGHPILQLNNYGNFKLIMTNVRVLF
ncbi:unnamed protein product [Acanthoscelides obtectus]|uniref:Uncharacterized protein n=1 Tax=Acanthoscelides obtectus TaxID=200917 RepID=A0A9P0M646_ACAOB|nr:unnamed protein product [Acanthoscelides obtectus]CAK1652551.1 hypothetical protein AOBTE_LOCUS17843 [Acanthoscelides obtectus]